MCACLILNHNIDWSSSQIFFNKNIYKNITIFNLLTRLVFAMVDLNLNRVTYFSTKITYTPLEV